jgi:hypothetical protein
VDNSQTLQASNESYPILLLYRMVKLLGTDGMSSESSEEGTDNQPKRCTVVDKNWRHPDLMRLLGWIDLHWSRLNIKTGTPFHTRLRLPHGQAAVSLRLPIAGLPLNFYHPTWYNGLTLDKKRRLGAREITPLPLHLLTDFPDGLKINWKNV